MSGKGTDPALRGGGGCQWMRGKKCIVSTPPANEELRGKIEGTATRETEIEGMRKDFHLLEAARETDQIVISLDETVRGSFRPRISTCW